jgi:hypothetical protein
MNIDQEILQMLQGRSVADRPLTIGDFARRFGASPQIIVGAARRLVDGQLAEPCMVDVHGVPTLHGLRPVPPVQAAVDQ